ncbi:hypothetical protein [Hymenobacter negativus]|uniref:DUF779 domain-containing protein n=1 Tax=Hymenobacter negativus TaxID=2795026 RepID=A0ABS3QGE4_9BACT|nr:hypothetical protein [Hymenobacter negativus]MBO2009864.1 hypothetical protein [Hymenobacter negativus]
MRESVPGPADNLPTPMEAALLRNIAEFYQNPSLTVQISQCRVVLREYSGCGFFTTLTTPANCPLIIAPKGYYGGSDVEATELSHNAGSCLFTKDGRLDFLEVFAYVDGDPAEVTDFVIKPMEADATPLL